MLVTENNEFHTTDLYCKDLKCGLPYWNTKARENIFLTVSAKVS